MADGLIPRSGNSGGSTCSIRYYHRRHPLARFAARFKIVFGFQLTRK